MLIIRYLNRFKGCNSCNTLISMMELDAHQRLISGYLVMAPDGRTNGRTDGHGQNYIPPPSSEDNRNKIKYFVQLLDLKG